MFNARKLRAAMVLAGVSGKQLAEKMGINESTFYRKMNADGDFRRDEINVIIKECHILNPHDIFFADELTETQENENNSEVTS